MNEVLLKDLTHYGKILNDYDYYDLSQGALRITQYYNPVDENTYIVVMRNGEYISIGLEQK